jgi:hypothetical protein
LPIDQKANLRLLSVPFGKLLKFCSKTAKLQKFFKCHREQMKIGFLINWQIGQEKSLYVYIYIYVRLYVDKGLEESK